MRAAAFLLAAGVGGTFWASEPTPAPVAPALPGHFMDGPPDRSSGGFGEPSCIDCHWGAEMNDPAGAFLVEGLPRTYRPGEAYELAVVLTRPEMAVGGFQMAPRFRSDSTQAGTFEIPGSEEGRLALVTERDVMYVQQTTRRSGITCTCWKLAPSDLTEPTGGAAHRKTVTIPSPRLRAPEPQVRLHYSAAAEWGTALEGRAHATWGRLMNRRLRRSAPPAPRALR